MKDYQVLIDHAWSLNPDLFEMFRQNFQIHLNKRRSIVEFQDKRTDGYRQQLLLAGGRAGRRRARFQTKMPARDILPRKIARDRLPLHPSKTWVTPIESIHPPQYSIAGLSFQPADPWGSGHRDIRPLDGMMFEMYSIRQVCAEFGWEIPDPLNEATKPRPYVRALMELEG